MSIPNFSFEEIVTPEGARHDKIEIGIGNGVIIGDANEVRLFLNYLASPPTDQRPVIEVGPYGLFFRRPQEARSRTRQLSFQNQTIRRNSFTAGGQNYPPPLFSGGLQVARDNSCWPLEVLLSLNPTRFVRHQHFRSRTRLHEENRDFDINFFERDVSRSWHGEFALVNTDNWIPQDRLWNVFASPRLWPHHLRCCLRRIPEAVITDIQRAASICTVELESSWNFNLRYVETYWEFMVNDPLGAVCAIQPILTGFSDQNIIATPYSGELEPLENSRCLKVETRRGETLKIYAKTNRRIRFEIVHELTGTRPFRIPNGHVFQSINGIFPLITHLTSVAARRVNQVLRFCSLEASVPNETHTVIRFIADVQAACSTSGAALDILYILVHNKFIDTGPGTSIGGVCSDDLRRLVRDGILRTSKHRYSVTGPYRDALSNLQQRGIGFLVGARLRRRRIIQ